MAFVGIGDYVAMRLTGSRKAVVHKTMAPALEDITWRRDGLKLDKLAAAGVDISCYPAVAREEGQAVGTMVMEQTAVLLAGGTAEPEAIPVFCAVGDNQASFLGAVKDKEHSVSINVGTGSQVSVYSGEWIGGRN